VAPPAPTDATFSLSIADLAAIHFEHHRVKRLDFAP
jgi:hypothetical protein